MRQRRKEFTPIDEIISHMLRFLMYIYKLGEYTFADGDLCAYGALGLATLIRRVAKKKSSKSC